VQWQSLELAPAAARRRELLAEHEQERWHSLRWLPNSDYFQELRWMMTWTLESTGLNSLRVWPEFRVTKVMPESHSFLTFNDQKRPAESAPKDVPRRGK
jgi:hypothetical protein